MCDCFHLAFPNWHADSAGAGGGRRLRGPGPGGRDDSICDEPSQFTEGERPRPQGSSPVEEYPEKYADSDQECETEYDSYHKGATGKKPKKSGLGSMFEKRSTPKMSKLKDAPSPESGVIVKTAKDGCAEGLVYGGGGKDGIFIKEVVPESPASKSLHLKEGDQVLSATVYFDNMTYEDAMQILEHAQAYKLKLCLKRKPEITETEPALESVIPEEEVYTPDMREQGKTKRRSDARISWPKFSSLGRGRKSHFSRSHSSSEADEQRKLELSPTTSDTESPIKSQDALKGKKRHKARFSGLKKRGRISSSEDQDTDTTVIGQVSGTTLQTGDTSGVFSHGDFQSPTREKSEVFIAGDPNVPDMSNKNLSESEAVQQKVELIILDSTSKTTDLTVAQADKETSPGIKSPDGKKKKERSELKIKILGKEKSNKKDGKAKPSPKRLKTLGASIETADEPGKQTIGTQGFEAHATVLEDLTAPDANESSKVISTKLEMPKVEFDISDVAFLRKSPHKTEDKKKKGKDKKQKTKADANYKLPTVGLSDVTTEKTIQESNITGGKNGAILEQISASGNKDDPYEQFSRAQLPKREEIEIPGMEDIQMRSTAKGIKAPTLNVYYKENQSDAVQMSIDVDSVKEAISKLPGYKLPKVDVSGVPIPEEITVIDANAQRISVKTPTKVAANKENGVTQVTPSGISTSQESSKTTVKLPNIPSDLTTDVVFTETRVDFKKFKTKAKQIEKGSEHQLNKREDIVIPGKESTQTGILPIQDPGKVQGTEGLDKKSRKEKKTIAGFGITKSEIKLPEVGLDFQKQGASKHKSPVKTSHTVDHQSQMERLISGVKITDLDGIEYIDSDGDSTKKNGSILLTGLHFTADHKAGNDLSIDGSEDTKFKIGTIGISMPKADVTSQQPTAEVTLLDVPSTDTDSVELGGKPPEIMIGTKPPEASLLKFKMPSFKFPRFGIATEVPTSNKEILIDGAEIKTSTAHNDVNVPDVKAELSLPDAESAVVDQQPGVEVDAKKPMFSMPKLSLSKSDVKAPDVNVCLPDVNIAISDGKAKVEGEGVAMKQKESKTDIDGQGGKFQMTKYGLKVPKTKQPETDSGLFQKDVNLTLPKAKLEVQLPEIEPRETSAEIEVEATEIKVKTKSKEDSPSRFKMPTFKLPKFGISAPSVTIAGPEKDVKIEGGSINIPEEVLKVDIEAPKIDIKGPSVEMKAAEVDLEGKEGKLKMPSLGFSVSQVKQPDIDLSLSHKDVDVTLPEANVEVQLPEVNLKKPSVEIEGEVPEIKVKTKSKEDSLSRFKIPTFKSPKFGIIAPSVTIAGPEKDVKIEGGDINIPEEDLRVDIKAPKLDIEGPSIQMKTTEVDHEGKGLKFKMPSLGFSVPQVKQPEIDLRLSHKDVDVTLPEANVEVQTPEVNLKKPSVEIEGEAPEIKVKTKSKEDSPSRFKMPTFKSPKFGIIAPSVTIAAPEKDVKIEGGDVNIPEEDLRVDIEAPKLDIKGPSIQIKTTEVDHEGTGLKFKMPSLGFSVPQVKQPEIDLRLSHKDVDVTLPEANVEVQTPEVKLKKTSVEIEGEAPEIKVKTKSKEDSPSRFKMPTFKLPKFGVSAPSVTIAGPEKDVKIGGDINIPEEVLTVDIEAPKIDIKGPSVEMKAAEVDLEGKGSKFKMPSLGFSVSQVKKPDIDLSLSHKDVDVTLPEANVEVQLPEVNLKKPSVEIEGEVPEIKVKTKSKEDSPSRFKMPTFKLPKFGVSAPSVTIAGPEKDVKIEGGDVNIPEEVLTVDIEVPKIDVEGPSIQMKTTEVDHEGKGLKFKMPSLGFSVPQVKQPDIDLSLSHKDVDVTLPGANVKVETPEVKLKKPSVEIEGEVPEIKVKTKSKEDSPSRFKMPTFKLPKFGVSAPSVTIAGPEKDVKIEGGDVNIPEEVLTVDIEVPKIDVEGPSIQMKTTEVDHEGKGLKFKMPSLGFSVPQGKQPEIDLRLSHKDVDVTLPEANVEVQLPEVKLKKPSVEIEGEVPEIKVKTKSKEDSPSRFKMPTFKLPKFGVSAPSVTIAGPEKDVKIEGGDINIPEEALTVDIEAPKVDFEGPSIQMKTTEVDHEGKGLKFKMPSLGFSVPQVKQPEIDLRLSHKDVDVTLPEANVEVQLPEVKLKKPSVEIEGEVPEIKVKTKSKEDSPSRFKMPTIKLPKFGISAPSVTIAGPEKDVKIKGGDINIPEEALTVDIEVPKIDVEGPSIQMKTTEVDHEGKGLKFKMPSLGFSVPQVKQPEIDLRLSHKDVDVTLPEANVEVQLPEVNLKKPSVEIEGEPYGIKVKTKSKEDSPSRFKMPTFKLPKFGVSAPSVTIAGPEKDVKIEGGDINIPEEVLTVDIEAPKIDVEGPSIHMKTTEVDHEGKGLKFKMPSLGFSVPQGKQPEIDLRLSHKDVDVTLPEANVEVQLPEVKLKKPSVEIEGEVPEIKVKTKSKEDSPSRFKMPTFKLPKFGVSAPSVTIAGPEKDVKIEGGGINIPEEALTVDIEAPKVDFEGPSIQMKTTEVDHEGKGLKFKMPSLGFSVPQVKQPEIDLRSSHKDVDVTLPEANVEVQTPEVKLKKPSVEIEGEVPEIKVKTKSKEDSPSRFKMPTFKLPKFGVSAPSVTIAGPEKDVKIEGGGINIPEEALTVDIEAPKVDFEGPSIQMKTTEVDHEGKGLKFKMPSLGFSVPQVKQPEIDLRLSHKDVDVTLPEANVEVQLPEVNLKKPSVEIEGEVPEIKVKTKSKEDSPSRFKMPTFKLPKFGVSAPSVTIAGPEKDVKIEGGGINIPEESLTVDVEVPKVDFEGPPIQMKTTEVDHEGKGLKFKMPSLGFSVPQGKQPEIDLRSSHKDVDVTLPEANVEVQTPEVKLKKPSVEIEGEVPEIKVKTKSKEDSPSRFKMPTFKLPKFGVSAPSVTIAGPEKDVKIEGGDINIPEEALTVDIEAPKVDFEGPSIQMKTTEVDHEGKGLKFKMPSLGFSVPQGKQPEIDLRLSHKDVDVTLPEANVEVQTPEVNLKKPSVEIEGEVPEIKVKTKSKEDSPSRFKMPTFKLPKFGVSAPRVTIAGPEKDVKIEGGDVNIPDEVLTVDIEAPKIDVEGPSIHMKTTEVDHEGKGLKFKMPSLGFSVPQVKQPEIDLRLSHKDVDVTLPGANVEVETPKVNLKKPSVEIEGEPSGIKVKTKSKEDSPSRFKMPTFKLPKFGVSAPSVTVAGPEKDVKIEGGDVNIPDEVLTVDIEAPKIDVEGPSIHMKTTEVDHEGKGLKFKMPSLGFSVPQVKQPEIDLRLSHKDVDVTLPGANVELQTPEVNLKKPSVEIEGEPSGIKVKTKSKEDSPSRFKMPTFKLPKFGVSAPSVTIAVPEKDVKIEEGDINITEEVLTVDIEASKIDIKGPSVEMKAAEVDLEGKGSKLKMPSLGFSVSQVKQPDIDLSLSHKDVDVTLPGANVEVEIPEVNLKKPSVEIEGEVPEIKVKTKSKEDSPSRFKMPTLKLPKFGISAPSVTIAGPEKDVKIEGGDINIPEEALTVDIEAPKVDVEGPFIQMKTTDVDHEGKGLKFKMPSLGFSVPQGKQPEIDLRLSHKDVDVTLPEANVEVQLPEVNLKKPSVEIEGEAPEIKVKTKSKEDSPSRFKMPTFKLPKFDVGAPSVTIKVPEKDVNIEGRDVNIPEEMPTVDIEAPKIDIEGPSVDMKAAEVDLEGTESKLKMQSLGFSVPQLKKPNIDLVLSQKDVNVTLPEANMEVQLPEVHLKEPSAEVESKAPEIKVKTKSKEDSPSRFKMPTFKLPKIGVSVPSVTMAAPEKDVKIGGGDINIPEEVLTVDIEAPKIDIEGPSVEMKATAVEDEGKGLKLKMPSLGFSVPQEKKPDINLSLSHKDVDVRLPEATVEVQLPKVELKEPSAEIEGKAPEINIKTKSKEDSPSRFKMPTFKLPKFGASTMITAPEKDAKLEGGGINIPKEMPTIDIKTPKIDIEGPLIEMKATEVDHEGKGSKLKMPSLGFALPQVKKPEIDLSLSHKDVDVTLPEANVKVQLPEIELKEPSAEIEVKAPKITVKSKEESSSRFKLPTVKLPKLAASTTMPAPEKDIKIQGDIKISEKTVDIGGPLLEMKTTEAHQEEKGAGLPHVEVSLSKGEVKVKNHEMEHEQQIKFKLPKFGIALPEVKGPEDDLNASKKNVDMNEAHNGECQRNENLSVSIKGPSVDIQTDESRLTLPDAETPNPETNSLGLGSPSKFKLPSFKMPKLNFSRPKPQEEFTPVDFDSKEGELKIDVQLDEESKTPNVTLGHRVLNNSGVEFDGSERGKGYYLEQPNEVPSIDAALTEQKEVKVKELTTKEDITKGPDRTGWFKFSKFGLSSPSSPAKTPENDEKKCLAEKMVDEEISPTSSIQSSDAFADISSAMTSETVGLSLSSPTKVTVKYSDCNTVTGSENIDSKVITSTTSTKQISVEPNLPEKITLLSSGVSSSSEDTLRLESGKIHVITSNIQMTPETQHAMLLHAVQLQSTGGPHVKPETDEAASSTVKESQGGKRTIFERHLVKKTSSETSESKETVVITKQITRTSMFESSEPISGETATSVQRLKQSVHSEKMRFFDGAEK